MTETVTGHQMGVYILEQKFEAKTGYAYNIDIYGLDDTIEYTKVLGVFTTIQNVHLAVEKLVQNTKITRKELKYRLVPKDELLIDLPSISEKTEDIYDF